MAEKKHTITITIDDGPPFTLEVIAGAKVIISTHPDDVPHIGVEPHDTLGTADDPDFKLE